MNLYFSIFYQQTAASPVGKPHAYTRIFHCTGNACIGLTLISLFYRLQRLRHTSRGICNLSVWQNLTRTYRVSVTDLPRRNSHHFSQQIQISFRTKTGLCHTKSSECSRRRIICVDCFSVNVNHLEIIWPCRMCTGTLQDRPSQRRIRACI